MYVIHLQSPLIITRIVLHSLLFDQLLYILCNFVWGGERERVRENVFEVSVIQNTETFRKFISLNWAFLKCFKTLLYEVGSLNHRNQQSPGNLQWRTSGPPKPTE